MPKEFKKMVAKLKGKKGVKNPFAVAYSAMEKKHGKGSAYMNKMKSMMKKEH